MIKTGNNIENRKVPHYQPRHRRGQRELSVWQPPAPPATTDKLGIDTTDLRDIPNAGMKQGGHVYLIYCSIVLSHRYAVCVIHNLYV